MKRGHMEAEFERLVKDKGTKGLDSACKAQDFHTMLDALLTSYVDVQTNWFCVGPSLSRQNLQGRRIRALRYFCEV